MPTPGKDEDSCDTIPPARLPSFPHPISFPSRSGSISPPTVFTQPNARKLCVRHQRIADEGTNLKLQQVRFLTPSSLRRPMQGFYPFFHHASPPSGAYFITSVS